MSSPARKKAEEKAMELKKKIGKQPKRIVGKTYVTKDGDTVSDLAKLMGTTVAKIKSANPKLKDVNKLPTGMKLTLPITKTAGGIGTYDSEKNPYKEEDLKVKLFQGGGKGLKPVPEGNKGKGLSKLPTKVRNKMGFLYGGGMPMPSKKPRVSNTDYRKAAKGMLVISIDMMKKKKGKGKGKKKS